VGTRGINPKTWFYGFKRHLNSNARHVRRALAGSAAEQWLNMELNAYLIDGLNDGLYPYPESQKRDISIFSFNDGDTENDHALEAVIESKAIYRQYSEASIALRVKKMTQQLEDTLKDSGDCKAIGLVFGVWANWQLDKDGKRRLRRISSLPGFRRVAGEAIRKATKPTPYKPAKPTMETLVPASNVQVGPWTVEVALVGQYFVRKGR